MSKPKLEDEFIVVIPKQKPRPQVPKTTTANRPKVVNGPTVNTLDELESVINVQHSKLLLEPINIPDPISQMDFYQHVLTNNPVSKFTINDLVTGVYPLSRGIQVIPLQFDNYPFSLPDGTRTRLLMSNIKLMLSGSGSQIELLDTIHSTLPSISILRNRQLVADWELDSNYWVLNKLFDEHETLSIQIIDDRTLLCSLHLPFFNREKAIPFVNDGSFNLVLNCIKDCKVDVYAKASFVVGLETSEPKMTLVPRLRMLMQITLSSGTSSTMYNFSPEIDFYVNAIMLISERFDTEVYALTLVHDRSIILQNASFDERLFKTVGLNYVEDEHVNVYPLVVSNVKDEDYINLRGTTLMIAHQPVNQECKVLLYCLSQHLVQK